MECKYNEQSVSPPQKYFSESHLNCLGLSFFLASVKAFNKNNRFIVFDDVISSFDTTHRTRFADLIFEEFKDYQVLLLTHESEWFRQIKVRANKEKWLIKEIKWDKSEGAYLDRNISGLKESIKDKINRGSYNGVGNEIRQYLEKVLKEICCKLKVKFPFKYNEKNECRKLQEFLDGLELKFGEEDLKKKKVLENIKNLIPLLHDLSHDTSSIPKRGGVETCFSHVKELEKVFLQKTD